MDSSTHTDASAIGHLRCGDGSVLTALLRSGNELADTYAKGAAMQTRAPSSYREEVVRRFSLVSHYARWVGHAAALANCYPVASDNGGIRFIRDSTASKPTQKKKPASHCASGERDDGSGSLFERSEPIAAVATRIRKRFRR